MTLSIIDKMIPILLSIIRLGSVGDREYYDIVHYRYDISYRDMDLGSADLLATAQIFNSCIRY